MLSCSMQCNLQIDISVCVLLCLVLSVCVLLCVVLSECVIMSVAVVQEGSEPRHQIGVVHKERIHGHQQLSARAAPRAVLR